MRNLRLTLALTALCGGAAQASLRAQQPVPGLASFLERAIGLNAKQLASIENGQPIVKVLRTSIDRDVAVFGIVSVDVPRAWFVQRFKAADMPVRSPTRSAFGLFGTPAQASDVGELSLSKDDVKDLKACRPRSCNFKLPASGMAFLHTRIDWNAPTVAADLEGYARDQMAIYVNDYRLHGTDAMVIYDDNPSVKASEALDGLLADSPYMFPHVPAFQQYVVKYPAEKLDSVTDVIFWSADKMPRTRAIVGIRHMSVYSQPEPGNATLIATKQLWSDHYLEASFDVLSVVDRAPPSGHESATVYLVLLRQFRFDNLPNNRLFSIRNRVANGLRDQAEGDLRRFKQSYEESYHPGGGP